MPHSSKSKYGQVNPALVLVLALLVGGMAGYLVGQRGPITVLSDPGVAPPDPYALSPEDEYIIAGFSCPAPACQDPLITCHCEVANKVKTKVKEELQQGKDGAVVREDLIQEYGAQLRKTL